MADMGTLGESADHDREIGLVTTGLTNELHEPQLEAENRPVVESEFKRFDGVAVREFVPMFVERRIRAELRALEQA